MDDAIRNALKKKRDLESELLKIQRFIETYEELTGTKVVQDDMLAQSDEPDLPTANSPKGIKRRKFPASPAQLVDAIERLIRDADEPLKRGQILDQLEQRNIYINSVDKGKYIGTILWRNSDIFTNIEGRGYWLNELGDPSR